MALFEFTKHLTHNKSYEIKAENRRTSYVRAIDTDIIVFTSPMGKITFANLNNIGFLQKNTVGRFICNIDLPQPLLNWLWDNLNMDDFDREELKNETRKA